MKILKLTALEKDDHYVWIKSSEIVAVVQKRESTEVYTTAHSFEVRESSETILQEIFGKLPEISKPSTYQWTNTLKEAELLEETPRNPLFSSHPEETLPVVRRRGRPPGSVTKNRKKKGRRSPLSTKQSQITAPAPAAPAPVEFVPAAVSVPSANPPSFNTELEKINESIERNENESN